MINSPQQFNQSVQKTPEAVAPAANYTKLGSTVLHILAGAIAIGSSLLLTYDRSIEETSPLTLVLILVPIVTFYCGAILYPNMGSFVIALAVTGFMAVLLTGMLFLSAFGGNAVFLAATALIGFLTAYAVRLDIAILHGYRARNTDPSDSMEDIQLRNQGTANQVAVVGYIVLFIAILFLLNLYFEWQGTMGSAATSIILMALAAYLFSYSKKIMTTESNVVGYRFSIILIVAWFVWPFALAFLEMFTT